MFLELFFLPYLFLSSVLAKCVGMKVVKETFGKLLQKVCCVWPKQIFVCIDEDFAIN